MSSDVPGPYWKSLLALSTAVTDEEGQTEPRQLDEENRKWLEKVMSDLVKDTDPSVQLANVLKSLHCYAADASAVNPDDMDNVEELTARLEDLLSYAFLTPQFINSGGLVMLRQFLEKHNERLRSLFASCVLTFTENNPPAQRAVVECGLLEYLLQSLDSDSTAEELKGKFIGAVSGTVRSDEVSFEGFSKLGGHEVLSRIAQKEGGGKVAAKAARVLASIAYTLQDSEKYAFVLLPQLVSSYHSLALRSRNDENASELEYIRDFFEQYVPKEKLSAELRAQLIEGLKKEHENKDEVPISNLLKKYD